MEPTVLYPHSQPEVLRTRLAEAGVTHNADARVNLEFEVMADRGGPAVFFCQMPPGSVQVKRFTRRGDGGALPATVRLNGFQIPPNLDFAVCRARNVRVITNGLILIEADRSAEVELADVVLSS